MKQFNDSFKSKLYETIKDIENNSLVEVVAVIRGKSANYKDVSLTAGIILMIVVFTWMMFSDVEFNVYLIYLITIFSFAIGFLLTELIKPLKRILIKNKRMNRSVEILGRAIFQKGGIRFTEKSIGVLFFVSVFEQRVLILPDRGAYSSVPDEEWEKMKENFNNIFKENNVADAFINELKNTKKIFAEYILPVENDINELPDDLDVEF